MSRRKYRVLLINPPVHIEQIYGKYSELAAFQPPVGLCSLAGYLRKFEYDVRILDAAVSGLSVSDTVRHVAAQEADLVGISANTANISIVAHLAAELKKTGVPSKIAVGGPHPTFMPEQTLQEGCFDFAAIGEGEQTLLELVRVLESAGTDFREIDGLAFKDQDGGIVMNRPRRLIEELDTLPFPAVDLLPDLRKYRLYLLHYKTLPYMTVFTSRGCPYTCVFCNTPFGKKVRYHSPGYVIDYIRYLYQQFGVRELHFSDDTVTMDERRIFSLCGLLQASKSKVNWYAGIRADLKDKTLLKEMKRAGCWIVAVGAESGDERILKLIKKNVTPAQILHTCQAVRRAGMKLKTFFIIGHPGETVESIDATIRFAKSLKAHFPVFSLMTPYPGTELWDNAQAYGTFDKSDFAKLVISTSDPIFIPYGLSKEVLLSKQQEAFRKVYFNFPMAIRQLCSIDSAQDLARKVRAAAIFLRHFIGKPSHS
ncbi:MAG TPA: radical SAM protein [Patescibacteria group bacterium]|nr:radical SAM protein [Patescibacteria group bacterium]